MSNFAFLQSEWSLLFEAAKQAEGMANIDARASCFYARRTLELSVAWMYAHDQALRRPYQDNLSAFIHEPTFKTAVGEALFTKARLIKDLGNLAVHSTRKVMPADALNAKLRPLAVTSAKPSPTLPAVPTLVSKGFDLKLEPWYALFAPAGLPGSVLEKLRADLVAVMQTPAFEAKVRAAGYEPRTSSDAELGQLVRGNLRKSRDLVRIHSIQPQ